MAFFNGFRPFLVRKIFKKCYVAKGLNIKKSPIPGHSSWRKKEMKDQKLNERFLKIL